MNEQIYIFNIKLIKETKIQIDKIFKTFKNNRLYKKLL